MERRHAEFDEHGYLSLWGQRDNNHLPSPAHLLWKQALDALARKTNWNPEVFETDSANQSPNYNGQQSIRWRTKPPGPPSIGQSQ